MENYKRAKRAMQKTEEVLQHTIANLNLKLEVNEIEAEQTERE